MDYDLIITRNFERFIMPKLSTEQQKQILLKKLEELSTKENLRRENDIKKRNYEEFMNRKADPVVGKAHHNITTSSHHSKQVVAVSVSGNCGHVYDENLYYTQATATYFHNVWSDSQRRSFQEKLGAFVQKEINTIISKPRQVIELMGLQSNPNLQSLYPANKIAKIKAEIKKAQWEILDQFSDDELLEIRFDLSHGCAILTEYLTTNRKHLMVNRKK